MEKIYGYKEKDVLGLAEFILSRKGGTLSNAFNEYALINGKAQGTIRNLYYALAKKSREDSDFCQKYFGGKPLSVGKIVEFDKDEEEKLVKDILREKLNGNSVRSAISKLANGDQKKALRYQNKFRNCLKNNPELVEKISEELCSIENFEENKVKKEPILFSQTRKIKSQINGLIDKTFSLLRKENDKLRTKNAYLERENGKLKQELGLKSTADNALRYFIKKDGNRVFN